MGEPEYYGDVEAYARLAKELKELAPVAAAVREYEKLERDMAEARELFSDPEMGEMAREEFESAKARMEELDGEIRLLLLPKDPNDERNVIIEIRSGVGGEESALVAPALQDVLHVRRGPPLEGLRREREPDGARRHKGD